MKKALLLICLTLTVGCATGGGKVGRTREIDFSRLPKTPEMVQAFQRVEKLYYARRLEEAKISYESYLKEFPYNALTPKTYFRLGEIAFVGKDFKQAIALYRKARERGLDPDWGAYAIYKGAVSFSNLDQPKKVLAMLDLIPADNADKKVTLRAASLRVTTANKMGDPIEAKRGYLEVIDAHEGLRPGEAKVGDLNWLVSEKTARGEIKQWIDEEADEKTGGGALSRIRRWYPRFEGKPSGSFLCWKMARLSYQKGDYRNAQVWAERYVQAYSKDAYASAARAMVAELSKRGGGDMLTAEGRPTVGVLLPLSGKYALYGESVLHGIECAAGVFAPCRGDLGLNLMIRDTRGSPAMAAKIVAEFAANPDVRAVIGPLPQVEVDQAADAAEAVGLPMISLSQKEEVSKKGPFIFRNFLTVSDQVATVVDYACGDKRWKKLAVLYPAGPTGEEYRAAFEDEVRRCGGKLVAQQSYPPETRNFTDILRGMTSTSSEQPGEAKAAFDALFVPDVYRKIPEVASALQFLGLGGVHLLGGAGWDHPALLTGGAQGLEGAVYVNGFFAKSTNFTIRDFVSTFQASYGVEPTLLEAYAFDTTRLLGEVLKDNPTTERLEIQKSLARKRNFSGVTGNISFDDDGDARRRLSVMTIEGGAVREVR